MPKPQQPKPQQPPAADTPSAKANASTTITPETLDLPHERDQQGHTADAPDPKMVQAKKDLDAGQVDTDLHNQRGVDAKNMPQGLSHIPPKAPRKRKP